MMENVAEDEEKMNNATRIQNRWNEEIEVCRKELGEASTEDLLQAIACLRHHIQEMDDDTVLRKNLKESLERVSFLLWEIFVNYEDEKEGGED